MGGVGAGGGGLTKLGIALTVIFVITVLALLAQLFYTLRRRRRCRTYTGGGGGDGAHHLSVYSSSQSATFSSKEQLLYFFCIRRNARLDSNSNTVTNSNHDRNSNRQLEMEVVDIDLLKLQGMCGPPRFLFTIKEGEREGFESPADKSLHSAEKEAKKIEDCSGNSGMSLEECFKAADTVVEVEIDGGGGGGDDATPFSTPCASPLFFTPSASPDHNAVVNVPVTKEGRVCCESKTAPLVRSEV